MPALTPHHSPLHRRKQAFQQIKIRRKHRYLVIKIQEDGAVVVEHQGARTEGVEALKRRLPATEPRFVVYATSTAQAMAASLPSCSLCAGTLWMGGAALCVWPMQRREREREREEGPPTNVPPTQPTHPKHRTPFACNPHSKMAYTSGRSLVRESLTGVVDTNARGLGEALGIAAEEEEDSDIEM